MSNAIKTTKVFEIINNSDRIQAGEIFSAVFVKRTNGEVRTMTCRLSNTVNKGKTGVGLSFNPKAKNLIPVFDMQKAAELTKALKAELGRDELTDAEKDKVAKESFRFINAEDVLSLSVEGVKIFAAA